MIFVKKPINITLIYNTNIICKMCLNRYFVKLPIEIFDYEGILFKGWYIKDRWFFCSEYCLKEFINDN